MRKIIGIILLIASLSLSCSKDNPTDPGGTRVGAVCNDGTQSSATGSGACSNHGGVDHWIYR